MRYDRTYWALDIEADNLRNEATTIHVVCGENLETGELVVFREAAAFREWVEESHRVFVGHNFVAYDAPVLNRLWGTRISVGQIIDTFILSQMYLPNMGGGHSLRAWGTRLKDSKIEFEDFSRYTPEMLEYCQQDVALTAKVYKALIERMNKEGFSERGIELEHFAWNIIQNKQKQNGFPFDQEKADPLYAELRAREEELKAEIYRLWPPTLEHVRTFARGFKSDGTRTANYQRHAGQYPKLEDNEDGSYNAYDYVEFDLGSPKQRIEKLLDYGWKPVNFTEKGSPKIDEDEMLAFAELSGISEVESLAQWCVINARANMIRNWMDSVNPATGNIHGSLFLASTFRYKHSRPNTANIPGNDKPWGKECRELFYAGGEDWKLVGMDGKGLQSRCLAHNIAKYVSEDIAQEFIEDLLDGDIHKKNMERYGFPTKPAAKKAYYTIMMGGGDAKIALDQIQFGWQPEKNLKSKVIQGIKGFDRLIWYLKGELRESGRIELCDGSKLSVPSDHMVIPYLLQGDESRLMKQTMVLIDREVRRAGLSSSVLKVADIHDEFQYRVKPADVDDFLELALPCFLRAGEMFDYLIPIEGDANVGDNWAETH